MGYLSSISQAVQISTTLGHSPHPEQLSTDYACFICATGQQRRRWRSAESFLCFSSLATPFSSLPACCHLARHSLADPIPLSSCSSRCLPTASSLSLLEVHPYPCLALLRSLMDTCSSSLLLQPCRNTTTNHRLPRQAPRSIPERRRIFHLLPPTLQPLVMPSRLPPYRRLRLGGFRWPIAWPAFRLTRTATSTRSIST